ncbi:MAG: hypothetical protein IPJ41_03615 [Phycisphaerales bacterium]|nr:hypothetical protein [Phycisphaerales bacterium]
MPHATTETLAQTEQTPDHSLFVRFVAGRDVGCPVCDYSIRDLTGPTCPECGCALELRVGSPHLRTGAWVFAIVSFALALGFDGVVSIMFTAMLVLNPTQRWEPIGMVTLFFLLAASMLAGVLLLVRRRTLWARRPLRQQWAIAIAIFLIVGLLHAAVGGVFVLTVGGAKAKGPAPSAGPSSS